MEPLYNLQFPNDYSFTWSTTVSATTSLHRLVDLHSRCIHRIASSHRYTCIAALSLVYVLRTHVYRSVNALRLIFSHGNKRHRKSRFPYSPSLSTGTQSLPPLNSSRRTYQYHRAKDRHTYLPNIVVINRRRRWKQRTGSRQA